jgi:hypothetical protein
MSIPTFAVVRTETVKTRLEGAALLALCAFALHRIYLLAHFLPHHEASPLELGLGLIAVLTGVAGATMLMVGAPLFRPYARPPPDRD